MAKKTIPSEIEKEVEQIIERFNKKEFKNPNYRYIAKYKGNYLYLNRQEYDSVGAIARLKHTGDINGWDFAIYKYSRNHYDPEEWIFPGYERLDGTIKTALKVGLEAYPLM